jgi:hypothetical protein
MAPATMRVSTAAREGEGPALLPADRGVGTDHRRQVHHDAVVGSDDELRTEDRVPQAALRGPLGQEVLLQPVEVGVLVTGVALAGRDPHRVHVDAVGLGALQQRHVLEGVVAGQRLDQVLQHLQVGLHLVVLGPPGDETGLLVDRGVDEVAHVGDVGERRRAGVRVAQVHRQVPEGPLAEDLRLAPRHRHDVPAVVEETVDGGGSDQSAGSGDEDGVRHGATPGGGVRGHGCADT